MIVNRKRLLFVLFLIAIAVTFLSKSATLSQILGTSDFSQINFETGVSYQLFNYSNDILLVSNEGVRAIDRQGHDAWSILVSNTNPSVDIGGKYILLYDSSGKNIRIYNGKKLLTQIKTPEKILSAKISKSGHVVAVTENTGFKAMVTVYNLKGEEVYKWHSGEGYVTDADISSSGKNVIASQIFTGSDKVCSKMLLFNISSDKITECTSSNDSLISRLKFNNDGSIVCLFDNSLAGFNSRGNLKYNISFEGRKIKSFNIDNEDNMVLTILNGQNNSTIESYTKNGKKRGSYDAIGEIKNINVNGEIILGNQLRNIVSITPKGKFKDIQTISHDIKNLHLFSDRDHLMVLGGNTADIIKIR